MPYEIEAPAKKKLSLLDRLFATLTYAALGVCIAGGAAWGLEQIHDTINAYSYQTPRHIQTADGDIGCVIWRNQMDCFKQATLKDEEMPEPLMEFELEQGAGRKVDLSKVI